MKVEMKHKIWNHKPVSYVIEFSKDASEQDIKNELEGFNIVEKVGRVYIIDEK